MTGRQLERETADRVLESLRSIIGDARLLNSAPPKLSKSLVLRLFAEPSNQVRARLESTVQNTLVSLGYPAAPALVVSRDADEVVFMVMELLPGKMCVEGFGEAGLRGVSFQPVRLLPQLLRLFALPGMLAQTQLRLHALPTAPLRGALEAQAITADTLSIAGRLQSLERTLSGTELSSLQPLLGWLLSHRRPESETLVICHGDLHPFNVLVANRRVTGVIDWSQTTIAERAFDVGITKLAIATIPLNIAAPLRRAANGILYAFARRYCEEYRSRHALETAAIEYSEVLRCAERLAFLGGHLIKGVPISRQGPAGAWDSTAGVARMISHVRRLTRGQVEISPRQ